METKTAATAQSFVEQMGYTVEVGPDQLATPDRSKVAYFLTGKAGAKYALIRHRGVPSKMYCVRSNGNICGLKGNYTFTDAMVVAS